ncbi:MAG: hypothetical protein AB1467_03370 [Candidatus Diapherotrites archaeon]
MPKKPFKPKARGPAYYVERVKNKINLQREKFDANVKYLQRKNITWVKDRSYFDYNSFFYQALGTTIVEALAKMQRKKGKPLIILEDGSGTGRALEELKLRLLEKKVPNKTIALSLFPDDALMARKAGGKIDEVIIGPAEHYVPKKPVDAIISTRGSIAYTAPFIRKDHLLKFAYSLKKGGIMMVNFEVPKELKPTKKESFSIQFKKIDFQSTLKGIERAFEKRGFKAKFYPQTETLNTYILIVRRIK